MIEELGLLSELQKISGSFWDRYVAGVPCQWTCTPAINGKIKFAVNRKSFFISAVTSGYVVAIQLGYILNKTATNSLIPGFLAANFFLVFVFSCVVYKKAELLEYFISALVNLERAQRCHRNSHWMSKVKRRKITKAAIWACQVVRITLQCGVLIALASAIFPEVPMNYMKYYPNSLLVPEGMEEHTNLGWILRRSLIFCGNWMMWHVAGRNWPFFVTQIASGCTGLSAFLFKIIFYSGSPNLKLRLYFQIKIISELVNQLNSGFLAVLLVDMVYANSIGYAANWESWQHPDKVVLCPCLHQRSTGHSIHIRYLCGCLRHVQKGSQIRPGMVEGVWIE